MRIIYLHGFASGPGSKKAAFFRERIPGLEVPDLAAGDFEHLTLTGQIRLIEELANGEAVSLIGSSLGGYLAAMYAAEHAEVAKLVLLAPAFQFAQRWAETPEARGWRETGVLDVYHYGEKRTRPLGYQFLEDGLRYPGFPDCRQPVLIFHGVHDTVVPWQLSVEFAAAHSNTRLQLLDSGHELVDVLEVIWRGAAPFLLP
jgi:pimeloyl-ACP methyl ester carboxylesterase